MLPRNIFVFLFVVSALLLASCGGTPATTSSSIATATPTIPSALDLTAVLSESQGTVEIKNADQPDFSAAADGMRVQVQGQVRTGTDSRVRLDLSTGTIVRVAPESLFTLQANEEQDGSLLTRLMLEAGQVWVILHGGQLEVETPSGVASVRGSFMSVWVDPLTGDVWVTCLEGWCQAENPTAALEMVAGEGASLYHWDAAGALPPPPPELRYLSQQEIDQFLANNPEAQQVMDTIIATASALPTLAPTLTPTPLASCFELGLPANGAALSTDGLIQFDWNDQPGAYKYIIAITKPNGAEKSQIVWRSSAQIDPSELPLAGAYQWTVTAFDSNIQPICTAGPWTFTKPASATPTPAAGCFTLTSPADGATLPGSGPVTFTWGEQPGRYKFIITITKPTGEEISLISWANNYTKNMELLPEGGTYQWKVTAYDSTIQPICSAGPWTFTKPGTTVSIPIVSPVPASCVTLLTPANGADFPGPARVDFTWSAYPGAYKYIITFKPPSTPAVSLLAWTPTHTRYIESLIEGGTYQWWVTVKNSNIQDICTSQIFTFTKPETVAPTQPPGSGAGLFWNQNGPTGQQASCGSLSFSVNTNNPTNGMVKVVYSQNSVPDGNVDPHIVLGNVGTTAYNGTLSLPANGQTVFWRFAIFDGAYTYDSGIYNFTCPNTNTSGGGGSGGTAQFWGQSGPTGQQASCASLDFSVSTSLTGTIKVMYSLTNTTPTDPDPHIAIGSGPGTGSGTLTTFSAATYAGQTVYWRFAVYNGSYTYDSGANSFTCP